MERVWLKHYPPGVVADVDVTAYSSVNAVLEHSIACFAARPAFANMGAVLTYAELDRRTRAFAAFLQQSLGLTKGERVAIMLPNLLQYPVAMFGALRAGLTVTNINPLYTTRELEHQLVDSEAVVIVILENFAHVLAEVLPATRVRHIVTTAVGDLLGFPKSLLANFVVRHVKRMVPRYRLPDAVGFRHALRQGAHYKLRTAEVHPEDLAFVQYTAGTTGDAKGVMLTHANIVANLEQASAWTATRLREGEEVIVTPLPLYHIFSLTANCLLFIKLGGLIHLITNPRDFKGFVRELRGLHFTAITGVSTLYDALLDTPGFPEVDFSSLKVALTGGMALQPAVAERWQAVTGTMLIEAYGLTEASPGVCINPLDLTQYNGKVGPPLPSTECTIQDEAGNILPPGGVGEICVRGPQVMAGYWRRREQTARILSPDGWLHTGDVGTMDERGYVEVRERMDDLINVSGFNVYPGEIEAVVCAHPGVREAAAVAVPDARTGHSIALFVVRKDPTLTQDELFGYCRRHLTGYKRPRAIEFRDSLPKSNIGKVVRRALQG